MKLGSLKDVLENEAIQLDWNFRMSLIHDIVKVIKNSNENNFSVLYTSYYPLFMYTFAMGSLKRCRKQSVRKR